MSITSDLKLSGNGTLTVTTNSTTFYGLIANNYGWSGTPDASALAAPGHIVTRSAMTDNGDGTYTWTYTVMPGTKIVNLSNINSDYEAQDGDILTGELQGFRRMRRWGFHPKYPCQNRARNSVGEQPANLTKFL